MRRGTRILATVLISAASAPLLVATQAHASSRSAQELVQTYAPIVMLRAQEDPPCDITEEQYEPTAVQVELGNPEVSLIKRPGDGPGQVIKHGPKAADIAGLGEGYYLNLPGDPLNPGCKYARDFEALKAAGKAPAVTYAHIAREQGHSGLAVQYWFFYYYNQFNDLHEGDWEGMQITFDADTPAGALAAGPQEIVLFQHAGAEKADWENDKVQKRGTHPVVYPAAGSHATYYDSAVWVGNGQGGSGVGCDNTDEPLRELAPRPILIPTVPAPGAPFQWLTYDGRWGQKEKAFNNGPTGPNTKTQWLQPFTWIENVRQTSPKLPGGSLLGPGVASAFCGTVATVTSYLNYQASKPLGAILIGLAALLIVGVPPFLTRWRPIDLARLRQPRTFGQIVRAARQLYGRHWRVLVPIGLLSIPIIGGIHGLEALVKLVTGSSNLIPEVHSNSLDFQISSSVSAIGRPLGFAVVAAVVISFMRLLERGEPATFVAAWRGMASRFWRVVGGQLLVNLTLLLLAVTVIGLPIAVWKFIGWQFVQQEILFEDKPIRDAFRGSSRLVHNRWWHTVRVAGFFWLLSVITGPVLLVALIFTNLSLTWIDILGAIVFALMLPYVAVGRTLLYFDLAASAEKVPAKAKARRRLGWRSRPRPAAGTAGS
jgi:hypothetical protein